MLPKEKKGHIYGEVIDGPIFGKCAEKIQKRSQIRKSEFIAEVCAISGFHKKHAIRLLNQDGRRRTIQIEPRGRPKIYQEQVYLEPLKRIWLATILNKMLMWNVIIGQ